MIKCIDGSSPCRYVGISYPYQFYFCALCAPVEWTDGVHTQDDWARCAWNDGEIKTLEE